MKYYQLDVGGNPLIDTLDGIIETLRSEMNEMEIGVEFSITAVEMKESEFSALPEWDGP